MNQKTQNHMNLVEFFRRSTALPLSSQQEPLPESIACAVEELAEMADALGDSLVTIYGIALQCTDEDKIDHCIDFCAKLTDKCEALGFDTDFIMNEIQAANLSKLCEHEEQAVETAEAYHKLGVKTEIRETETGMIAVYCAETVTAKDGKFYPKGKLLKSVYWREPKFDSSNIDQWIKDKDMLGVLEG